MDTYVTGNTIKELRQSKGLTQAELAEKLCVSDKTVSKWETSKGYPDITLLEPLAKALGVSAMELLSGNTISNMNQSANMQRSKFYVCPVCGNVINSVGELAVSCHGVALSPQEPEPVDTRHEVSIETIEDEYFVSINHDMTKDHYISFIAAVGSDRVQVIKLYPEGAAEARFKKSLIRKIYFYCNKDGLFEISPIRCATKTGCLK